MCGIDLQINLTATSFSRFFLVTESTSAVVKQYVFEIKLKTFSRNHILLKDNVIMLHIMLYI